VLSKRKPLSLLKHEALHLYDQDYIVLEIAGVPVLLALVEIVDVPCSSILERTPALELACLVANAQWLPVQRTL
jgi:hypothetical protein